MPLTISELEGYPLECLRRESVERLRFPRGVRILLHRRWLAMRLGCFSKPLMALLCFKAWTELVDDYVDGDRISEFDSKWHLEHVRQVLDALQKTQDKPNCDDLPVMIYDWWIVTSVRLAKQIGRPILDKYIEAWKHYVVDSQSVIDRERFSTHESLKAANQSAAMLFATGFYILGVDFDQALELTQAFTATLLRTFVLRTILTGIARFESKVTRDEFEEAGVDTTTLLELLDGGDLGKRDAPAAWARVGEHRPFVAWYITEAVRVQAVWQESGGALWRLGQLVPAPYGWVARRMLDAYMKGLDDLQTEAIGRFACKAT